MPASDQRYISFMPLLRAALFTSLVVFFLARADQARAASGWACATAASSCPTLFIVHNSWHAAIVLRKEHLSDAALPELIDFPDARFIEFSWGDKDYFPHPNSGFFLALKAAFWSSGSVLHLVGLNEAVEKAYPRAEIIELRLSTPAFERLIGFISKSFSRPQGQGRAPARAGLYSYSRFYPSSAKFSALNTCNTWVAQALETAGLPISPAGVISAAQLSDQLETIAGSP
jgi:uncharacterized protein (TIGR02117 family)